MNETIEKILERRGITDIENLDDAEKETFNRWQAILSDGEITVEKIQKFCINQIGIIEAKWRDLDNPTQKNDRLIIMHTIYKSLLDAMTKPKVERENLEKYLQSLIE